VLFVTKRLSRLAPRGRPHFLLEREKAFIFIEVLRIVAVVRSSRARRIALGLLVAGSGLRVELLLFFLSLRDVFGRLQVASHAGGVEQPGGGGPVVRVEAQHPPDQRGDVVGVDARHAVVLPFGDLVEQTQEVRGRKRRPEGTDLIQQAAQSPDVRLGAVGDVLAQLWTQVAGRAHARGRHVRRVRHHPGDPKVS